MRLYHFTKLETALKFILPQRQLKIGRFETLNDPFELWGVQGGDADSKERLIRVKDHWWSVMGVMCFGQHWMSPVMWAHYGDNHTGVALGFDLLDDKPREMQYRREPKPWFADHSAPALGANEELFKDMVTTKYERWRYEEEWRLFVSLDVSEGGKDFFYPFNPDFRLKEIILGAKCPASVDAFRPALRGYDEVVSLQRAKPDFAKYAMVRDPGLSNAFIGHDVLFPQGPNLKR